MLTERLSTSRYGLFEKLKSIDYFLILIIILIGAVSVFAIYSTEGGKFSYYTTNHLTRLLIFFFMFLILSFVRITTWYRNAYFFYLICLFLLLRKEENKKPFSIPILSLIFKYSDNEFNASLPIITYLSLLPFPKIFIIFFSKIFTNIKYSF